MNRVPRYPVLLSFLLGTGSQIYVIFYVFLFSMVLGMFNWYLRYTWVINFFMVIAGSGWINGFVTSVSLKSFGIADMIRGSTFSAFIYPSMILICCVAVDLIETIEKSSAAIPMLTLMIYGTFMMTISVLACYHGAMTGYTAGDIIEL